MNESRSTIRALASSTKRGTWGMVWAAIICSACLLTGCGTTNTYTVTEQLLLSDAVDKAVAEINFEDLKDEKVYLDSTRISPSKQLGIVNTDYLIGSLRQQLIAAGCLLQDDKNSATVVLEPRIGALGTENQVVTFGIPKSQELSTAASIFANAPLVPTIPEIAFGKSTLQYGAAKVSIFAYERETKEPVWQSGTRLARSNSKSTWVMGAGPLERGSIYNGWRFAGFQLELPKLGNKTDPNASPTPEIPYYDEVHFVPKRLQEAEGLVRLTSSSEAAANGEAADGEAAGAAKETGEKPE